MSDADFNLAPSIDVEALAERFARRGRVQIAPFLDPADATALADHLLARDDWRQIMNAGEKVYESVPAVLATLTDAQRTRLEEVMNAAARDGFQYRYQTIRVPDDAAARAALSDPLAVFARFMASAPVLDLLARIIGDTDINFADAQATIYKVGDFLTGHNDGVAGKKRRAAYVFGMTPQWRAEWGGLLLFHGGNGGIAEGFVPAFNTLSLFAVPQQHSVSQVTPWAGGPRLSVTGWLRALP
ncbi:MULTISPECIES: 2OG-Fe(II) oxygenase [unclassified Sphingomonas]|uniref:2OG-Fe(II) oxygenase n=1 Tax=unclassified Sphingomonas TaxID=196159 RepID=UPI00082CB279|nr:MULTISPECIES: 2OG-Fe(II) oxygenase family protein [unclassified Sphingomonas]